MYKTNKDAILASIDNVNEVAMEADMSVIHAMADSYEKAAFIMENYTGDESNMFSIFQEDAEVKKKSWLAEDPDEGIFMKIIKFIPRMIAKLWEFIKSAWKGQVVPSAEKASNTLKNIPDNIKKFIDKFKDKDESWLSDNKAALGFGGAAAAAGITLIVLLNKNRMRGLMEGLVQKISKAFHNVGAAIKDRKVLFEVTVGAKVKTTVGFKKIVALVQALPEYFRRLKELKKYNKSLDKLLKAAKTVDINVAPETYEIVLPEDQAVEVDLAEICENFVTIGKTLVDLTTNPDTADISSYNILSETGTILEEIKDATKKSEAIKQLKALQKSVDSVNAFTQGLTVDGKKGVLKDIISISEQIEIMKKSSENGASTTEESEEEGGEESNTETNNSYADKFKAGEKITADDIMTLVGGTKKAKKWHKWTKDDKIILVDSDGNEVVEGKLKGFSKNFNRFKKTGDDEYTLESVDITDESSNSWYGM